MRSYAYVGPAHVRAFALTQPMGTPIRVAQDLAPFATGMPLTFVIDATALLRVADQRSEHVACAGGGPVLSAGELCAIRAGTFAVVLTVRSGIWSRMIILYAIFVVRPCQRSGIFLEIIPYLVRDKLPEIGLKF